ncbi:hypothetical protein G3I59_37430 [Amycolatopsis rubida]|uniref:Crotonobetainyl-CoA:carnitine CoA-transferase CaiB n=1 Tax=Amycolatopsis rubida TaxID=112413 RepID=A0ABX0C069_9PSEU|nr:MULTISPECIES: CoA transferase [Amycolatopsis]MYW96140.1 hypothetical protein [Amycolatopsis rubida]NEC61131.1 hypothetical protein [Amycolatopsis rubida]OAP23346.1 Succinyl-CoA:(R)-benzylsuccinate CoA-transferase subunit BbsF [Amycolatopsis sp. M39]
MSAATPLVSETPRGRGAGAADLVAPEMPWLNGIKVSVRGTSAALDVARRVLAQLGAEVRDGVGADADVVLVDRIETAGGIERDENATAAEYLEHVEKVNNAVWVTASAYGLGTERQDAVASDLTLLAEGGILGHSRISDELVPTVPPGRLGLKLVGYVMAVAALHAVHVRRETGDALHVDVSAQGAVIATGLSLEMAHALSDCPDEGGSARYGAPSGFFPCSDGLIYVLVLEQHQWEAFRRVLEPALEAVETLVEARDQADFVNSRLASWASSRAAEECERILQNAGVPCTQINTLDTLSQRAAKAGRPVDLTSPDAPPLPAQVRKVASAERTGHRTAVSLSDLRVLDAGHVLAVPLGASWLGAMGASVTKLEDPQRLDIYRRRGPFAAGVAGLNRSAYFNQLNSCKTSLDIDPGRDGTEVDLEGFDVVLHNLTPRRAKVVGVDSERVLADAAETGRAVLAISSSGFGGTGDWAGYRAYGHNIHAFAGLVAATRDARGEMGDMGTPWADPLTSVALAAWVLAWSLAPERASSFGVDISMAELTAAQIADLGSAGSEVTYRAPETGGDFFITAPGDRRQLAVSLRSAEEVARFERIAETRLPPLRALGQLVEADLGGVDLAVLSEDLRGSGIPASLVHTAHDLADDPFVRGTGLYQTVRSEDLGDHDVTGLPWHFIGQPRVRIEAAPERPHG